MERKYHSESREDQWVLSSGEGVTVVSTPVDKESAVFKSVQPQFEKTACNLIQLWEVEHSFHRWRYEQKREQLAAKWGILPDQVVEKRFLFHSTSAPLDVILVEGLRCDKAKEGLYGKGIYAAHSVVKASSYWKLPFNRRIMLCLSMLVGVPHVVPPNTTCRDFTSSGVCDSVLAFTNFHEENVVFDDSQVLITHFADYEVTPDYVPIATRILQNPFCTFP